MSKRIPASEGTWEGLRESIVDRLSTAAVKSELMRMATRLIIEEGLESKIRYALDREYYARGGELDRATTTMFVTGFSRRQKV